MGLGSCSEFPADGHWRGFFFSDQTAVNTLTWVTFPKSCQLFLKIIIIIILHQLLP